MKWMKPNANGFKSLPVEIMRDLERQEVNSKSNASRDPWFSCLRLP